MPRFTMECVDLRTGEPTSVWSDVADEATARARAEAKGYRVVSVATGGAHPDRRRAPQGGADSTRRRELEAAMEHVARGERGRQSRRALLITFVIIPAAVVLLALGVAFLGLLMQAFNR